MIRRRDYCLKFPARPTLPPGRSLALKERVKWMITRVHQGRFKGDVKMSQITGAQANHIRVLATDWAKAQLEADRLRQENVGPWVPEPCPLKDKVNKSHPIIVAIETDYSVHDAYNDFVVRGRRPYGMRFQDAKVFENYFESHFREHEMDESNDIATSNSAPNQLPGHKAKPVKPKLESKAQSCVKNEGAKKEVEMVSWIEMQPRVNQLFDGDLATLIPWLTLTYRGKYSPNSCVVYGKKGAVLIVLAWLYLKLTAGYEPIFTRDEVEALLRPVGIPKKFCEKNTALMGLALCDEARLESFCTNTHAAVCLQNTKEETKFKNDAQNELRKLADAKKMGRAFKIFQKALANHKISNF